MGIWDMLKNYNLKEMYAEGKALNIVPKVGKYLLNIAQGQVFIFQSLQKLLLKSQGMIKYRI